MKDFLCRWLCGRRFDKTPPPTHIDVPPELRAASHRLSNAASNLQAAALTFKNDADVVHELVHAMQGDKGK